MKKLAILLALAIAGQAQTVSNIQFPAESIGATTIAVTFNVSAAYSGVRLRFGTSNCAGGTGGTVRLFDGVSRFDLSMTLLTGGLTPSTLTYFCPEVYNGLTWSSGVAATATTAAVSTATPSAPTAGNYARKDFSGYTVRAVPDGDCDNVTTGYQARLTAAAANQATNGSLITITPTTTCAGHYTLPNAVNLKTFTPANVETSTGTINITHGFSDNDRIQLSAGGGVSTIFLPGAYPYSSAWFTNQQGPIEDGFLYYAHVIDSTHFRIRETSGGADVVFGGLTTGVADSSANTISIAPVPTMPTGVTVSTAIPIHVAATAGGLSVNTDYYPKTACSSSGTCTIQLALTPGGAAVDLTSSATHTLLSPGAGNLYVVKYDPTGNEIITTSSEYTSLPPEGTRVIGATHGALMPKMSNSSIAPAYPNSTIAAGVLSHNYRFWGIEFRTPQLSLPLTTLDPPVYGEWVYNYQDTASIIYEQIYAHGWGYPDRLGAQPFYFQGANVGMIDSDVAKFDRWRPVITGFVTTRTDATHISVSAGSAAFGDELWSKTASGASVLTLTGGVTNATGHIYFDIAGVLTAQMGTGTTGSWSCSAGITCALTTAGTPTLPLDGSSRRAGFPLATVTMVAGLATAVTVDTAYSAGESRWYPQIMGPSGSACCGEGPQVVSSPSPGPNFLVNNHFEAAGIAWHYSECGPYLVPADYYVAKNWFETPAYALLGGPLSDGLRYGHRNALEWKCGKRAEVTGNLFTGQFGDVSPASIALAITPRERGVAQDFKIANNRFLNGVGGSNAPFQIGDRMHAPIQRVLFTNNTFMSRSTQVIAGQNANGWALSGSGPVEGWAYTHNFEYAPTGNFPFSLFHTRDQISGMTISDNVLAFTGGSAFSAPEHPECGVSTNKAYLDCLAPGYTFGTNVIVPSYTSALAGTGTTASATVTAAFSGLSPLVPDAGTTAANWAYVGAEDPANYRFGLTGASPYATSCSASSACGINEATQLSALGDISAIVMTPAATSIALTYTAPDTRAVRLGYSTDSGATWTWASDGGGTTSRSESITGLTASTAYLVRLEGYHDQTAAMGFSGDRITTQTVTTTAGPTNGSSLGGNAFIGGNSTVH